MRKLSAILLTFTILILLSCSDNSANSGTDLPPEETWEVMGDVLFEDGLAVSALWPEDVQANGGFENTNTDTIYFEKRG